MQMVIYELPLTVFIVGVGSTGLGVFFATGATGATVPVVGFATVLPASVNGGTEFTVGGVSIVGVAASLASVGDCDVLVGVGEFSKDGVGVSASCIAGVAVWATRVERLLLAAYKAGQARWWAFSPSLSMA